MVLHTMQLMNICGWPKQPHAKASINLFQKLIRYTGKKVQHRWSQPKADYAQHCKFWIPGCTHWVWKNCLVSLAGKYKDKEKYPAIVLEAISTQDQRIWHELFGTPVSLNYLNVLNCLPLFQDTLYKRNCQISLKINGNHYHYVYYPVDGIDRNYTKIIKAKTSACNKSSQIFRKSQQAPQKDVECIFSHLKGWFHIIKHPGCSWSRSRMVRIILCCICQPLCYSPSEKWAPGCAIRVDWWLGMDTSVRISNSKSNHLQ